MYNSLKGNQSIRLRKLGPVLALLFASAAFAEETENVENQDKGKLLSQRCMGCHGEFGISSIESNPNLAGQNKKYLVYALKAYRDGERKGGLSFIMQANASSLSNEDIEALASYYSSLPGRTDQKQN